MTRPIIGSRYEVPRFESRRSDGTYQGKQLFPDWDALLVQHLLTCKPKASSHGLLLAGLVAAVAVWSFFYTGGVL